MPWFSRPQRVWIALLVSMGYLAAGAWWLSLGGFSGTLVDIDRVAPQTYQLQIDLNQCDWAELTILPDIGETMARRIIRYRNEHGPFLTVEQLIDVRGIGPKTLERLRPFFASGDGLSGGSDGS